MALISSGGSLTATVDTATESTAQKRWNRQTLFNSGVSNRLVTVKIGTLIVFRDTLVPDESRDVGPYTALDTETWKTWEDAGTDVQFRNSGEDDS